jgi:hypothetical protein
MKASPDPDALVPRQRTYRSLKPSSLSNQFTETSLDLFLPIHVGEAERFLTVVLDLQLVLLVELDLAEGRKRAGPFAILIDVEHTTMPN